MGTGPSPAAISPAIGPAIGWGRLSEEGTKRAISTRALLPCGRPREPPAEGKGWGSQGPR